MPAINESTYFFRDVETTPRVPKVVDVVAGLVKSYLAWRKQRADIAVLQGLSAPQLKDIGLYPNDMDRIAGRHRFPLSMESIGPQF